MLRVDVVGVRFIMTDDDEHARVVERLLGLGDGVILNLYAKLIELFEDAKR